ncbi:hypothetical protein MAUB1S_02942 [Mycolicibacterium aubagnense]
MVLGPVSVNSSDINFTRAARGSAECLESHGHIERGVVVGRVAATGAQHSGSDISMTGSALGMPPMLRALLTYIEKVRRTSASTTFEYTSQALG